MDADLIVALATAPGRGAIAIVRVSGHGCGRLLSALSGRATFVPRRATRVRLSLGNGLQDEALALWFPGPHSYTGEDSFEVSVHGGPVVASRTLEALAALGARPARPGEFTLRAFLNGRMDLVQAEAVADLVDAVTPAQARVASAHLRGSLSGALSAIGRLLLDLLERLEASLDFPDEGYHFIEPVDVQRALDDVRVRCEALLCTEARGRVLRDGARLVIVGRPNVGKSSLFNALVGHARAIVTTVPGTTRDALHERIDLGGVPVEVSDTAGWRETVDEVEREGVARARSLAADADGVLVVVDGSLAPTEADQAVWQAVEGRTRWLVVNKADVMSGPWVSAWAPDGPDAVVSAQSGEGVAVLQTTLAEAMGPATWEPDTVTRARHAHLLRETLAAVTRAASAAAEGASEEFVAADVRAALVALEEIRGRVTPDAVLEGIFSRFCIGK